MAAAQRRDRAHLSLIHVERIESAAAPGDLARLFAALDERPGVWMGCDVEADGLFRKASMACAVPALRFCLDGPDLTVTPLAPSGQRMLGMLSPLADFRASAGGLLARMTSGTAVVDLLRRFLAMFEPRSPELALYGSLSFDYYLLAAPQPLPDDRRRRVVLYFPERVLAVDGSTSRWIDFRFALPASPAGTDAPAVIADVRIEADGDEMPQGGHAARVAHGVELLRRARLHSLVLSQAFRRRSTVRPSLAFDALRRRNPYPAMFFCNLGGGEVLFGASPDLQVRADAQWVEAAPVCGTVRRGEDPLEDAAQALALFASDKEAASLALCADAAASDHAAVCEPGSVELLSHRRLHFFSTIIHTVDHLRGRRRSGADAFDILLAHSTPATVTGLPKRNALQAIGELEPQWRGWYAGAVARIGSDGSLEAYTVLRAARMAGGVAEIRVGGNLLVDSDPAKEEEETRLKAQTLFRVLEAEHQVAAGARGAHGRWRLGTVLGNDTYRNGLINALAAAGAIVADGGSITVLSGAPTGSEPVEPLLAVGEGALWLLRRAGARAEWLQTPAFGRTIRGRAVGDGFLRDMESIHAGWYVSEVIGAESLPENWEVAAVSEEGWVLAAQHRQRRVCAILFRPDSVLSLRGATGVRALRAAFAWLDPHGMFDEPSIEEEA